MKYILSIFFLILLTGCHIGTGRTAKTLSKGCTSLCIQAARLSAGASTQTEPSGITPVPASLTEKTASILVW